MPPLNFLLLSGSRRPLGFSEYTAGHGLRWHFLLLSGGHALTAGLRAGTCSDGAAGCASTPCAGGDLERWSPCGAIPAETAADCAPGAALLLLCRCRCFRAVTTASCYCLCAAIAPCSYRSTSRLLFRTAAAALHCSYHFTLLVLFYKHSLALFASLQSAGSSGLHVLSSVPG